MSVRKASTDIVQDLLEKASTTAKPASIINSNGRNCPNVQSYSDASAGQMESCIHSRICMNSRVVMIAITKAAIRRGTRANHSNDMILGCFIGHTREYMAAKLKLKTVKATRMAYWAKPGARFEPHRILKSALTQFPM